MRKKVMYAQDCLSCTDKYCKWSKKEVRKFCYYHTTRS